MTVSYTPPRVNVSMVRDGMSSAKRAIARITGPLPTGQTVYKVGATWYMAQSPSQDTLDTATYVFIGGHVYDIADDIHTEIVAAGFG
jgi:hypothetical protein